MGNALQDITEDGNVWDDSRMKLDEEDAIFEPTFVVAPLSSDVPKVTRPGHDVQASSKACSSSKPRRRKIEDEEVFLAELDRPEGMKLGMGMRIARNGRLEVSSVDDEGVVATWNREFPLQALRPGDRIIEVNGASTKDEMLRYLISMEKLFVKLGRDPDLEFDGGFRDPNTEVFNASSSSTSVVRQPRWKPLDETQKVLLNQKRLLELHPFLPLTVRFASNWKLIYCPRIHGTSLRTFYRQCQAWPGETLFLIEDTDGAIFGGFASNPWKVSAETVHFGSPSCMVFSYGPVQETSVLQVYPWAGGNDYFMFADTDGFSMGGGGSVAVWVDKDFGRGISSPSATFGNEAPLSTREDFEIRHFECWGFDSDNFGSPLSQAMVKINQKYCLDTDDERNAALRDFLNLDVDNEDFADPAAAKGLQNLQLREMATKALAFEAVV